jgi:hypothetical protein
LETLSSSYGTCQACLTDGDPPTRVAVDRNGGVGVSDLSVFVVEMEQQQPTERRRQGDIKLPCDNPYKQIALYYQSDETHAYPILQEVCLELLAKRIRIFEKIR